MTIYDLYIEIPKEDVNILVKCVCKKHYHVKKQEYDEADRYRSIERDIYDKWHISGEKRGQSLVSNLISTYGDDFTENGYNRILRDLKINDLLQ